MAPPEQPSSDGVDVLWSAIAHSLLLLVPNATPDRIISDALERLGEKSIPQGQIEFHGFASGALYDAIDEHLGREHADTMMGRVIKIWHAVNLAAEVSVDDLTKVRVLVVDDDALALRSISRLLVELGAEVHTADDAQSALELVDQARPDVIIADYDMPGESGVTLANIVSLTWGERAPPIICLTGVFPPPSSDAFHAVLTKPTVPSHLVVAIQSALARA